ncbi:MAG: amidohydrolase family protein [Fimbriimonadaceae bacterium]|nr:amidohydrolase family protein [Fimbriimonadaceae bacterium]QYK56026.1 MAG: amidohydrolase family protein [Fimbriimonadaceae bacterium]
MSQVLDALGPQGFGAYLVEWDEGGPILERVTKKPEGTLVPGFVDIHAHGGVGVDGMTADSEGWRKWLDALCRQGYESLLPTTVASSVMGVQRFLSLLPEDPMVAGFHMEGPFISPARAGAQPKEAIALPPSGPGEWDDVLNDPRLKLVTLAPELPNATALISRLRDRNVTVSMGHTDADYDEARIGFEFGASNVTHMFNAMRPFHHRSPGIVGYALTNPDLTCELVYDRVHVAKEAAELLFKCKPLEKIVAVSDAAAGAGLPNRSEFELWGHKASVVKGVVSLEDGTLAGSASTLYDSFRFLWEDFGAETAIRLCCLNPRRAAPGLSLDPRVWLTLDPDLRITETRRVLG